MKVNLMFIGGFFALTAVLLGAMGAHALKTMVSVEQLQSFETGVRYQMYHALALLWVHLVNSSLKSKLLNYASILFIAGTFLFSGSIYMLSLKSIIGIENTGWLGPITPIGGSLLIIGWALIMVKGLKRLKK